MYSSILKTHKIYSPRRPGTRDLCTDDDDNDDDYSGGGGGGGDDSECHLNVVEGRYGFLMPRDFCTFSDNDYGCSPDGLSWRTRVCVCVCVYLGGGASI